MLGEWDGAPSALEEVEALKSIYTDELEVNLDENGACNSISLWLYPATADKVEEQYVRIYLKINLPDNYPEDIPEVCISNPRGLSDEQINRIIEKLLSIAENSKGYAMLFELIQAAKEQLTAENRPNEDCAICLYGFDEEDIFTKTECYHYFHSHCLSRYVKCKMAEENDGPSGSNESKQTPLCPVCRVPVSFSGNEEDYPEPVAVSAADISLDLAVKQEPEMEKLYQKQLAQGGIIDVEAEKNKFLLEIANVPTTTESQTVAETTRSTSNIEKSENDNNKLKKHSPTSSPRIRHNYNPRNRGGYRQPYRKRNERNNFRESSNFRESNNFRESKNYTSYNQCQNNRSHFDSRSDVKHKEDNQPESSVLQESSNPEHSLDGCQDVRNRVASNNYHRQAPDAVRNNRSRGYMHQSGSRNMHNHQSYNNYNDALKKPQNVGKRNIGGRNQDFSTNNKGSSSSIREIDGRKSEDEEPNSESHDYSEKSKPVLERYERRPNYHPGPRFQDRRNYQQPRYQKYHESSSVQSNFRENDYNEEPGFNHNKKFNPRSNRPNFNDTYHQRYGDGYVNYNSRNKDQANFSNRYEQSQSPRFRGYNNSSSNRRWNGQDRNKTVDSKSSYKSRDFKELNVECEGVRQNVSKLHLENNTSGKVKSQESGIKVSDIHKKSMEKYTSAVHPPPGFANPLKKVVYGLPSLNPPPGFSEKS